MVLLKFLRQNCQSINVFNLSIGFYKFQEKITTNTDVLKVAKYQYKIFE